MQIPRSFYGIFCLYILFGNSLPTVAAFTFDANQTAQGVLIQGVGTLNTNALSFSFSGRTTGANVYGAFGIMACGPVSSINNIFFSQYSGITGPASFGGGGLISAGNGSGDIAGVGVGSNLDVPVGYLSGTPLSDSAFFTASTFASLGLTPGTYVYTWGNGPTADSLTINIGTAVPEPASLAMIAVPLGVAQLRCRRGRRPS